MLTNNEVINIVLYEVSKGKCLPRQIYFYGELKPKTWLEMSSNWSWRGLMEMWGNLLHRLISFWSVYLPTLLITSVGRCLPRREYCIVPRLFSIRNHVAFGPLSVHGMTPEMHHSRL